MPQIYRDIGLGEKLGTGLGTGIGEGISSLADFKLKQLQNRMQQQKTAPGLAALFPEYKEQPNVIESLSALSPELLKEVIKQKSEAPLKREQLSEVSRRKEEELDLKKQAAIERVNKPFITKISEIEKVIPETDALIDKAMEVIDTYAPTTGPLAGQIPPYSEGAQLLDNILNQILLKKSLFESKGIRATNLYFNLQKAAKASRQYSKDVLKKILGNMQEEIVPDLNKINAYNDILNLEKGIQPSGFESKTKNLAKIFEKLPNARDYEDETEIETPGGYKFKKADNRWNYIGGGK